MMWLWLKTGSVLDGRGIDFSMIRHLFRCVVASCEAEEDYGFPTADTVLVSQLEAARTNQMADGASNSSAVISLTSADAGKLYIVSHDGCCWRVATQLVGFLVVCHTGKVSTSDRIREEMVSLLLHPTTSVAKVRGERNGSQAPAYF